MPAAENLPIRAPPMSHAGAARPMPGASLETDHAGICAIVCGSEEIKMEPGMIRGTTAHQPDLNWSQVRETVLMLELAAVQIETAMTDSSASVDVLAHSFTTMAGFMQMISETIKTLPDQGEVGAAKQRLSGVSDNVSGMMQQAIIA